MKTIKYIFLSAILLGFIACNDDDYDYTPEPEPLPELTAGSVDFSNYVAVGASFTAGFTDGALFIAGQENSFPNILNQQFANVGGGTFTQPLMSDNIGGLLLGGNMVTNPRLYFFSDPMATEFDDLTGPYLLGLDPRDPSSSLVAPTTEITNILNGPFNNMGVPGAKSFHLLAPGYGNVAGVPLGLANPYFARMATSSGTTILADALAQNPTFFTLSEIGGNDVLAYATSGGTGVYQLNNLDPSTYGGNDITDPNVFAQVFNGTVTALTANGAKGVVANVPYITDLPHFTTVPYNPLSPTNPAFAPQIPVLNATFAPLNQAFAFLGMPERQIVFSETEDSPVIIQDETLPNIAAQLNAVLQGGGLDPLTAGLLANQFAQSRQATADDLFVLPSSSIIAEVNMPYFNLLVGNGVPAATAGQLAVNGVTFPLEDKWVLIPSEQNNIRTATDAYNTTIANVAATNGLALVDFKAILQEASTTGISDGDFNLTTDLVTGGLVSLDGIHLTARGYSVMANEFLKAIDATYGSNFIDAGVKANPGDYPTNYSPAMQ